MKLIYLLLALLCVVPAQAQQEPQEEKMDLLQASYQKRVELLEIQDKLLKSILSIPFEKRVYIYPALFESRNMSKKILTHPQVLMWKGKKPTKIAPQMQEFAKEHLDYMPAQFYPLLDPDGWPKQSKEGDWHAGVDTMLKGTVVTPNEVSQEAFLKGTK